MIIFPLQKFEQTNFESIKYWMKFNEWTKSKKKKKRQKQQPLQSFNDPTYFQYCFCGISIQNNKLPFHSLISDQWTMGQRKMRAIFKRQVAIAWSDGSHGRKSFAKLEWTILVKCVKTSDGDLSKYPLEFLVNTIFGRKYQKWAHASTKNLIHNRTKRNQKKKYKEEWVKSVTFV